MGSERFLSVWFYVWLSMLGAGGARRPLFLTPCAPAAFSV